MVFNKALTLKTFPSPCKTAELKSLFFRYKSERRAFIRSMRAKCKFQRNLPSNEHYVDSFILHPDLIIVGADKNLGYVCLRKRDLLEQYERINRQQHNIITITWYLEQIYKFI